MRDLDTARAIVRVVLEPIMATSLGDTLVEVNAYEYALDQAAEAVADLLDPDEVFDVEIEVP